MLPSPAGSYHSSSTAYSLTSLQNNYNPTFPIPNPTFPPADQSLDPNSPETFKQNIQLIQQHVARLNELARSALNEIENAYRVEHTPSRTEANISALKPYLYMLYDLLRQSGVGALPLLPIPETSSSAQATMIPTEEMMLTDTTQSVQVLYERMKRTQESAAVVANLLSAPESRIGK